MTTLNVSDVSSHGLTQIENAADILKSSPQLRSVFEAVYKGKKQPKNLEDLKKLTGINSEVRILQLIQRLAAAHLVDRRREKNQTNCYKVPSVSMNRVRILAMAKNTKKLEKFRKKNRGGDTQTITTIRISKKLVRAHHLTVDDLASFSAIRKIAVTKGASLNMLERDFNNGVRKVIKDKWEQLDWGGETDDLYTTRLLIKNNRIPSAFAFKGRGTKGILVPGKMGKNGDQIQRLFRSPAELFVVQYQGPIAETVIEQMKAFAEIKSVHSDKPIYYMIIDGQDSDRLVRAYPKAFKS